MELQHYEARLLKLRHLQADHVSNLEKHRSKVVFFFIPFFFLWVFIMFFPASLPSILVYHLFILVIIPKQDLLVSIFT